MKNSIKVLLAVLFASTLIISCKEKQEEAATEATTEVVPQEAAPVEAPVDSANAPK